MRAEQTSLAKGRDYWGFRDLRLRWKVKVEVKSLEVLGRETVIRNMQRSNRDTVGGAVSNKYVSRSSRTLVTWGLSGWIFVTKKKWKGNWDSNKSSSQLFSRWTCTGRLAGLFLSWSSPKEGWFRAWCFSCLYVNLTPRRTQTNLRGFVSPLCKQLMISESKLTQQQLAQLPQQTLKLPVQHTY